MKLIDWLIDINQLVAFCHPEVECFHSWGREMILRKFLVESSLRD